MASAYWGKFASEVVKEVKFKYDHTAIRQELVEHMEELYEDLRAEGMDAHVAEIMAVEYMGDAAEIGKALNEEHSPLLGWIWRMSRWAVAAMFLICMVWYGGGTIKSIAEGVTAEYITRAVPSPLVYSVKVDETVESYGAKMHFDEIRYYENRELEIRLSYLNWNEEWNPDEDMSTAVSRFQLGLNMAYERDGEVFSLGHSDVEWNLGQGVYFKNQIFIRNFPDDAEKLYISYDRYMKNYIKIDLPKGGEG